MGFADVAVRLNYAERTTAERRAHLADAIADSFRSRQTDDQPVGELIAPLVSIDAGHDHLGGARSVKGFNEGDGAPFRAKASQQAPALRIGTSAEPQAGFFPAGLFQNAINEGLMDSPRRRSSFLRKPCGFISVTWKRFVLGGSLGVSVRRHLPPVQVEPLGDERPVAKPDSVATAELPADGRNLNFELPVVVPFALNASPVAHPEFPEQLARLAPLAAATVEKTILEALLGGEDAIGVPGPSDSMPTTPCDGRLLAKLTAAETTLLDGGAHRRPLLLKPPPPSESNPLPIRWTEHNAELCTKRKEGARTQRAPTRGTAKRL